MGCTESTPAAMATVAAFIPRGLGAEDEVDMGKGDGKLGSDHGTDTGDADEDRDIGEDEDEDEAEDDSGSPGESDDESDSEPLTMEARMKKMAGEGATSMLAMGLQAQTGGLLSEDQSKAVTNFVIEVAVGGSDADSDEGFLDRLGDAGDKVTSKEFASDCVASAIRDQTGGMISEDTSKAMSNGMLGVKDQSEDQSEDA